MGIDGEEKCISQKMNKEKFVVALNLIHVLFLVGMIELIFIAFIAFVNMTKSQAVGEEHNYSRMC